MPTRGPRLSHWHEMALLWLLLCYRCSGTEPLHHRARPLTSCLWSRFVATLELGFHWQIEFIRVGSTPLGGVRGRRHAAADVSCLRAPSGGLGSGLSQRTMLAIAKQEIRTANNMAPVWWYLTVKSQKLAIFTEAYKIEFALEHVKESTGFGLELRSPVPRLLDFGQRDLVCLGQITALGNACSDSRRGSKLINNLGLNINKCLYGNLFKLT